MKSINLAKLATLFLASNLLVTPVKAITYDKDEILEETKEDINNNRDFKKGVVAYDKGIILMDYFISDDKKEYKTLEYENTVSGLEVGSYVLLNGSGSATKDFKDTLGVIVGIKSDRDYPYAVASLNDDYSLGNIIGWFKYENLNTVCVRLNDVVESKADVKRYIGPHLHGPAIGVVLDSVNDFYEIEKDVNPDDYNIDVSVEYDISSIARLYNKCKDYELMKKNGVCIISVLNEDNRSRIFAGDIIYEIEGKRVNCGAELIEELKKCRDKEFVNLKVIRDGRSKSVNVLIKSNCTLKELVDLEVLNQYDINKANEVEKDSTIYPAKFFALRCLYSTPRIGINIMDYTNRIDSKIDFSDYTSVYQANDYNSYLLFNKDTGDYKTINLGEYRKKTNEETYKLERKYGIKSN